jgi:hypothetical protein
MTTPHHLQVYDNLCATKVFQVNGIDADTSDFGEGSDDDWDNKDDVGYGCSNRVWRRIDPPPADTLRKYDIRADDYKVICDDLEASLSFGNCGLCN